MNTQDIIPDHPQYLSEPRTKEWIDDAAKKLEKAINDELHLRWPFHSVLTYDALVDEVVTKYLNAFWRHIRLESYGWPTEVKITGYEGKVDES